MVETILRPCSGLHCKFLRAPAGDKFAGGCRPIGKNEFETCVEKTAGNDLTALEDELGFGSQEEGADLNHP